jgi:hypothetical protein
MIDFSVLPQNQWLTIKCTCFASIIWMSDYDYTNAQTLIIINSAYLSHQREHQTCYKRSDVNRCVSSEQQNRLLYRMCTLLWNRHFLLEESIAKAPLSFVWFQIILCDNCKYIIGLCVWHYVVVCYICYLCLYVVQLVMCAILYCVKSSGLFAENMLQSLPKLAPYIMSVHLLQHYGSTVAWLDTRRGWYHY